MKKLISYLIIVLFFTACSSKSPINQWKIRSINSFDSYKYNFLIDNDLVAKRDLKSAIKYAKQSADLSTLAKIYLGECALNYSHGIEFTCTKVDEVLSLMQNIKLNSYYSFIRLNFNQSDIINLPNKYQKFASNILKKNYNEANIDIVNMSDATSKLIASSLIKDNIDEKTLNHLLEVSSLYGYKKSIVFLLSKKKKLFSNKEEIEKINKKLFILRREE